MERKPIRAAILASGSGSNAENILHFASHRQESLIIPLVVSDKSEAFVLERAKKFNVPSVVITKNRGERREDHEARVIKVLKENEIDWVFLAGYMRLLTPTFLTPFYDEGLGEFRVLNVHPSLLPEFPGVDSYKRAFDSGVLKSGVTIHFVNHVMDGGRIICQESFNRLPCDSFADFEKRGRELEFKLYRDALTKLIENKLGV